MSRFAPFDRVIVTDLRDGTQTKGVVSEAGGPMLVVELDDGRVVMVGEGFVTHDDDRDPTDVEIYGAGA